MATAVFSALMLSLLAATGQAATVIYYSSTSSWQCPSVPMAAGVGTYVVVASDLYQGGAACGQCMSVVSSPPNSAVTPFIAQVVGVDPSLGAGSIGAGQNFGGEYGVAVSMVPCPGAAQNVAAVTAATVAPTPPPTTTVVPPVVVATTAAPVVAATTAAPVVAATTAASVASSNSVASSSSAASSSTGWTAQVTGALATYYSQPNSPTTFACASNNKAPTTTLPSVALAAGGAFGWQSDFSACNMCLEMRGTGSGIGNSPVTTKTSYFQVTNSCLDPQCAPGHLDIYVGTSQSAVSGAGDGIWSIEWSPMDCAAAQAAYSASGNQWQGLPTGAAAGRRRLGSWSRRNRKFMLR